MYSGERQCKVRLFGLCLWVVSIILHGSVSVRVTPQRSCVHEKCGLLRVMRLQGDSTSPGTGRRTGGCGPCPLAVMGDSPGTADGKIKSPGELTWLHLELSGLWQVPSPQASV